MDEVCESRGDAETMSDHLCGLLHCGTACYILLQHFCLSYRPSLVIACQGSTIAVCKSCLCLLEGPHFSWITPLRTAGTGLLQDVFQGLQINLVCLLADVVV